MRACHLEGGRFIFALVTSDLYHRGVEVDASDLLGFEEFANEPRAIACATTYLKHSLWISKSGHGAKTRQLYMILNKTSYGIVHAYKLKSIKKHILLIIVDIIRVTNWACSLMVEQGSPKPLVGVRFSPGLHCYILANGDEP